MADSLLSKIMAEVLEASRATDDLTRQVSATSGALMEFALLPERLDLRIPVSLDKDGAVVLGEHFGFNGELRIKWRRTQTPETVRAEIDDINEIDGLVRDNRRTDNLRKKAEATSDDAAQ